MKFLFFLFLIIQSVCYSQIDSQNNGLEIPAVPESNQNKTEDIKKLPLENKGLSNIQKNISGIPFSSNIKIKSQEKHPKCHTDPASCNIPSLVILFKFPSPLFTFTRKNSRTVWVTSSSGVPARR